MAHGAWIIDLGPGYHGGWVEERPRFRGLSK
jgi:hypothetical protein